MNRVEKEALKEMLHEARILELRSNRAWKWFLRTKVIYGINSPQNRKALAVQEKINEDWKATVDKHHTMFFPKRYKLKLISCKDKGFNYEDWKLWFEKRHLFSACVGTYVTLYEKYKIRVTIVRA